MLIFFRTFALALYINNAGDNPGKLSPDSQADVVKVYFSPRRQSPQKMHSIMNGTVWVG
ncbi:MAG: hypothetical protein NC344_09165 [Bacteroidales bacterium]|nr:hypothetical protein [Bacteroidales bacterium]MCM1147979.1 hypothetical protein [Bacteroidales bacterium]MCM1206903.1 hypothetical protein [Bacillota bacterium]MCM1509536.1 hypothetical protein [Clostridium sp.]